MTRRVFSFDPPDRFICGAVGQPGQRTFFLQASKGAKVVSVALEKAQVAVLAERLAVLLLALREQGVEMAGDELLGAAPAAEQLTEPVVEEFRVGTLTLAWDEERERVVIEAREITAADVLEAQGEEAAIGSEDPVTSPEGAVPELGLDDEADLVRVLLEPSAAHSFVSGAVTVVQAGRPPCPMCGEPLDAGGHFCSRRNGYAH